jgi:hypothetical protein
LRSIILKNAISRYWLEEKTFRLIADARLCVGKV